VTAPTGPDPGTGLENQWLQASLQQVRSGRQADRAGPDHHHRQPGPRIRRPVKIIDAERQAATARRQHRPQQKHELDTPKSSRQQMPRLCRVLSKPPEHGSRHSATGSHPNID
jgi:hypothetical protein